MFRAKKVLSWTEEFRIFWERISTFRAKKASGRIEEFRVFCERIFMFRAKKHRAGLMNSGYF